LTQQGVDFVTLFTTNEKEDEKEDIKAVQIEDEEELVDPTVRNLLN
jgi:hypothetical protein